MNPTGLNALRPDPRSPPVTGEFHSGAARRDPACPRHVQIAPEGGKSRRQGANRCSAPRIISIPS
jgi:hypothetical protein